MFEESYDRDDLRAVVSKLITKALLAIAIGSLIAVVVCFLLAAL